MCRWIFSAFYFENFTFTFSFRFVVATRKITGGEIIFKEEPQLLGPRLDPNVLPMCSGCFGKLGKMKIGKDVGKMNFK